MGVAVHILDRRTISLKVGGTPHEIGTLRHVSKLTELDGHRAAELERAATLPSPVAVMVVAPLEMRLASAPGTAAAAHLVIGWDEGRGSVTDMAWDYLPVMGYAVRDAVGGAFTLHELCDGTLHPVDGERAAILGLLTKDGSLRRRGQPAIAECRTVRPYAPEFAVADCVLEGGRHERLFMRVEGDALPDPSWLVGRRPMDVERYGPGATGASG